MNIYPMADSKSKNGHSDITSTCPKNYDSKKKQLNEFIHIESLRLIFCIIHF